MVVIYIVVALIFCLLVASWFFTQHIDKKIEKNFRPPGQFSNVQQEKIHYTKQGQGPALILIHGLAGNALNFTALANQLAKHYTVYSIDRPGSGFSTRHRNTSADFSVQSATILAWMSQLNLGEVFVAGHSMGGAIALRMALDAPDKIKSVSLLCPLTVPLTKGPGPLSVLYIPYQRLRSLVSKTLAAPLRIVFGKKQVAQIFFPERVPSNFGSESGGALALHSESFYEASCDMVASTESLYKQLEHYKTISCPVGILYGEQDAILSPDAHMSYIATSLPSSMAEIIPNAGHMIINTQPEACFNFINKVNKVGVQLGLA
ncbi:alpha/beta fold hydrolase [Alteromonas stellipolaris]|uniref:alpha/beta fold hydrolase n=1 Tax=Alteromonas stellipolaris TaxID=233316 RepID=UPI0027340EF0|nr:alpha/beta hydrolase [Alteromonas stellipolaris]MDP2535045.1 alpha/beta hydrolase [Alteromonas stellipolaris]